MSWTWKQHCRSICSSEVGSISKEWGGKISIGLVYPNHYSVGMGNLGVHAIYGILNDRDDVVCERIFLPSAEMISELKRSGSELTSIESQAPLVQFDILALSVSYENDYLNILPILELAGIPFRSEDRDDSHPIIIAGGAAPTLNPKAISAIADAVLTGEFEGYCDELLAILGSGDARSDKISAIMDLRRVPVDISKIDTQTRIYTRDAEFGDMHLMELQRGCPHRCAFCSTPYIYGRARSRNYASAMRMINAGIAHRQKFGLVGFDILSHPSFSEIAREIFKLGATFSPSSIRVDAIDDNRAAILAEAKIKSVALGIEAGDEAQREAIGKKLSTERIMSAIQTLAKVGITKIRPYIMIGLPGSQDDEVDTIADILMRIRDEIRGEAEKNRRSTSIDATFSPFVPKPHSGFDGKTFAGEKVIKNRIKELQRKLGRTPGITLGFDSPVEASIENYFANAGSEAIDYLIEAHISKNPRAALKKMKYQ